MALGGWTPLCAITEVMAPQQNYNLRVPWMQTLYTFLRLIPGNYLMKFIYRDKTVRYSPIVSSRR